MFTSVLHSEVLRTTHAIFQCCHPGLLMADAMQNPSRLSILWCKQKLGIEYNSIVDCTGPV